MPCLAAVDRYERMAQNVSAPVIDRMQPDTLILSLAVLTSRSAALLSKGASGSAVNLR
jgi:hypothetical protein